MILSELIPFLQRIGARPRKSLSQNFLTDPNIARKMIQIAAIEPGDSVLEIGPGPGALTASLLERGAHVYAVEIDPLFAQELQRFQNGSLTIFPEDILKFSFDQLPPKVKVIANLPYHITTPILERLFSHPFISLTLMVQKEVADRMFASAGSKQFGSLSLFVQYYTERDSHFIVPSSCFYPSPKVASTVLRLNPRPLSNSDPAPLFRLIHTAFQQRRKMVASTLPFPKVFIHESLSKIGVRLDARPEALSLEQWMALANHLIFCEDMRQ